MPVPKRKLSRSRRDKRSANKGIKPKAISACLTCQEPIAAHQACTACGYYKGVKILKTKADRVHVRGQEREAKEVKKRARTVLASDSDKNSSDES